MNVITHDMAISLFPIATFDYLAGLICPEVTRRHAKAIQKYVDRGWRMMKRASDDVRHLFPAGSRSVMDSRTWRLKLSSLSPALCSPEWKPSRGSLPLRIHPVMPTNWALHFNSGNRLSMCFNVIASRVLRHWYIIHDEALFVHLQRIFTRHLDYILSGSPNKRALFSGTLICERD